MSISIRTNAASLYATRSVNENSRAVSQTSQQLASGLRINGAADDPAGLAIASGMRGQILNMMQDQQNIAQAIAMAQTIDGALAQQNSILQRFATLAAQGANGSLTDAQRAATIQPEVTALAAEFDKIGNSAAFNGISLLAGGRTGVTSNATAGTLATGAAIAFQSNVIGSGDTVTVSEASGVMTMTWTTAGGLQTQATANSAITVAGGGTTASQSINFVDAAGSTIATATVAAGATAQVAVASGTPVSLPLTAGTANAFVFQIGPSNNTDSEITMTVSKSLAVDYSINNLNMSTQANSKTAITTVANAITKLGTARANIGGSISQLTQAEEFISSSLINAQTAMGAITDVDVATAAADLAGQNVLVQAATAMLAQTNQSPNVVLSLLR